MTGPTMKPTPRRRRAGRRRFGAVVQEASGLFTARWEEGGRRRGRRGFRTRTDADAFLARIRTALADGVLQAERRAEVTVSTVADEWLRTHSAVKLRSHTDNVERWSRLGEFLGPTALLSEITPTRILELREHLRGVPLAPATVNRYLALLRSILNYAVTAGYLQVSPVRRFARGSYLLPEPRPKRSPPLSSNAEAARLLAAIREGHRDWLGLFAFLLLTGSRRGEAAGLRWEDVDLTRRLVTIRRSYEAPPKSGKARTVPISTELAAVLAEHRKRDPWGSAVVFPHPESGEQLTPGVKLGPILDAACTAAGVARMRVHDLRHAHASLWLMAGGTLADVQRNLGHSTPVLTSETYGHIAEDHRVREADTRLTLGIGAPRPKLAAIEPEAGANTRTT